MAGIGWIQVDDPERRENTSNRFVNSVGRVDCVDAVHNRLQLVGTTQSDVARANWRRFDACKQNFSSSSSKATRPLEWIFLFPYRATRFESSSSSSRRESADI